jgi:ribosome-associated translation inhibitor RaiA
MKLVIHGHHLRLPPDLPPFLWQHVTRPLARLYDDEAAELAVLLEDGRPRRGGVDRTCRLSFKMPGTRTLHVESVQQDLQVALLDAGGRLRRLVRRELEKMRSPSRKAVHRPLGRTYRVRASRRGITPGGGAAGL